MGATVSGFGPALTSGTLSVLCVALALSLFWCTTNFFLFRSRSRIFLVQVGIASKGATGTALSADCRDSLLLKAVRRDEGLEVEVADPKKEVREGEAGEREGKDKLKSEGLQCR